jgi:hypothetical protein
VTLTIQGGAVYLGNGSSPYSATATVDILVDAYTSGPERSGYADVLWVPEFDGGGGGSFGFPRIRFTLFTSSGPTEVDVQTESTIPFTLGVPFEVEATAGASVAANCPHQEFPNYCPTASWSTSDFFFKFSPYELGVTSDRCVPSSPCYSEVIEGFPTPEPSGFALLLGIGILSAAYRARPRCGFARRAGLTR